MSELPKTFEPRAIEDRWYTHWEANGLFRPDRPDADDHRADVHHVHAVA